MADQKGKQTANPNNTKPATAPQDLGSFTKVAMGVEAPNGDRYVLFTENGLVTKTKDNPFETVPEGRVVKISSDNKIEGIYKAKIRADGGPVFEFGAKIYFAEKKEGGGSRDVTLEGGSFRHGGYYIKPPYVGPLEGQSMDEVALKQVQGLKDVQDLMTKKSAPAKTSEFKRSTSLSLSN